MAIEKFRFVSPGVQFNEIDESAVQPVAPAIGPVVIGRTAKGPFMQPVVINTVAELEKIFGPTSNGNVGANDVWRSDAPTAPTFATYAAKAFLQNSAPITVLRLGGVAKETGYDATTPGWSTAGAQHLFALSGTTATLAAVLYTEGSTVFQLSNSAGIANGVTGSYSGDSFTLYLSKSDGRTAINSSLSTTSISFLRKVLNTNSTRVATDTYFLGETFEDSLPSTITGLFITSSAAWKTRTEPLSSAQTGYVVGDHISGADPTNLFIIKGINSGGSLSREIKISIENVRASTNEKVTKYGTFDVVVRKLFENASSAPLERFNGVNLDPLSDNYILKRIGDSVREWDATNLRYVEKGLYSNNSAFIRVELSNEDISPYDLPHGFRIPGRPQVGTNGSFSYGAVTYTASHPDISLLTSSVKQSTAKVTRFGLRAVETVIGSNTATRDLVDIIREKPSTTAVGDSTFSTRFITSSSGSYSYISGTYNSTNVLTAGAVLGFDLPFYGGTDGADITEAEPFVNFSLLNGSQTELTSPAYRSISQAIDIVADPEVLDMNLLCIPNLKEPTLTTKMVQVCRTRGDAMAIIDLEGDFKYTFEGGTVSGQLGGDKPTNVTTVINNLNNRQIDDSYGAAYFPAVFVPSENIFMPASIAALGAFGGTEGRSALWFAPAGFIRGGLTLANAGIGVSRTALTLNSADRDLLYQVNINPIATFPNEGVVIFGQKTLQKTPSALDRVNVRRLMNFIKKQISRVATRVLFEPNVERTWNNFSGIVNPFLLAIKNAYGLDDARVVLDASTTTADLVDRNIMYCKIFVKPTRAIEYIAIDFVVTNSGAAFTE